LKPRARGRMPRARADRPPHGGRGLKLLCVVVALAALWIAPRTGGAD